MIRITDRVAYPPRPLLAALVVVMLGVPVPAAAGTLCGMVRDAQTALPVPGAVILLFSTAGAWTGHSAVTGGDGGFCIPSVPAGTYDLQAHVRNHLIGTVRNIVVREDVTGIVVDGVLPVPVLRAVPSPARSATRLLFSVGDAPQARIAVHDIRGRFLRGWSLGGSAGEGVISWDFRDVRGDDVPAGVYFVFLTTDTGSVSRRVVRLP